MKLRIKLGTSFLLSLLAGSFLLITTASSQDEDRATVDAFKKYILEKDYPEVFGDQHYHVRIDNLLLVDVDNDGKKDVVVQFAPHYRQSATIVIYKISPQLQVTRVMEGLAPGRLQKLSGDYLDSHELGEGVDFSLDHDQTSPEKIESVLKIALFHFGGVVVYRGFYHVDGRKGPPWFIDMRNVELSAKGLNCATFEFSDVRQIAVGNLREDAARNYLAAWVGDEIYVYLIKGVSEGGFLDKKLWVVKAPADFKGFIRGQNLTYETPSGIVSLTLAN